MTVAAQQSSNLCQRCHNICPSLTTSDGQGHGSAAEHSDHRHPHIKAKHLPPLGHLCRRPPSTKTQPSRVGTAYNSRRSASPRQIWHVRFIAAADPHLLVGPGVGNSPAAAENPYLIARSTVGDSPVVVTGPHLIVGSGVGGSPVAVIGPISSSNLEWVAPPSVAPKAQDLAARLGPRLTPHLHRPRMTPRDHALTSTVDHNTPPPPGCDTSSLTQRANLRCSHPCPPPGLSLL
jgi:hypothetical protein